MPTTKQPTKADVLADAKVGDYLFIAGAQPDLRCRQITRRTPKRVFTAIGWYDLGGLPEGNRRSSYRARLATQKDIDAWRDVVAARLSHDLEQQAMREESAYRLAVSLLCRSESAVAEILRSISPGAREELARAAGVAL